MTWAEQTLQAGYVFETDLLNWFQYRCDLQFFTLSLSTILNCICNNMFTVYTVQNMMLLEHRFLTRGSQRGS